jgi:hypothetical protein
MALVIPASASNLPSPDEINGIMKLCAVGRSEVIEAIIRGKLILWEQQADASGKASLDDLGGILAKLPEGQQIDPAIYKLYTDCVKESVSKFLQPSDIIRSHLVPAQENSPPNPCKEPLRPGDMVLYYGSNAAVASRFPHTVLQIQGRKIVSLNKDKDGGLTINFEVYGEDGRAIVEIQDNVFTVNSNNYYTMTQPDRSSLIIYDRQQHKVLDVKYLNESAIKLSVISHYSGRTVEIGPDSANILGIKQTHSCFGHGVVDMNL